MGVGPLSSGGSPELALPLRAGKRPGVYGYNYLLPPRLYRSLAAVDTSPIGNTANFLAIPSFVMTPSGTRGMNDLYIFAVYKTTTALTQNALGAGVARLQLMRYMGDVEAQDSQPHGNPAPLNLLNEGLVSAVAQNYGDDSGGASTIAVPPEWLAVDYNMDPNSYLLTGAATLSLASPRAIRFRNIPYGLYKMIVTGVMPSNVTNIGLVISHTD